MKDEIEYAIKILTGMISASMKSEDALKVTQATLNLTHALATLDNMNRGRTTLGEA
jgi:hypothetical protein